MNYFERLLSRALAQTGRNTQSLFDPFEQTVADLEWPISKAVPTNESTDAANAILPPTSLVVHETTLLNGKASTEQADISESQAQTMAEPMAPDLRVVPPPSVMPKPPDDDQPVLKHSRDLGSVTETNHHALQHADEFMRALGVDTSIGTSVSPRTEKIESTKAQTASAMPPSPLVRPAVPVTPKTSKERPPSPGGGSADTVSESSAQKNNEPRESIAETTIPTRLTTPRIETHVVVRSSSVSWVEEIQRSRSRAFGMGQL